MIAAGYTMEGPSSTGIASATDGSSRYRSVGAIDDPGVGVASLNDRQRPTHAHHRHDLREDLRPQSLRFEVPLRVDACRHRNRITKRNLANPWIEEIAR